MNTTRLAKFVRSRHLGHLAPKVGAVAALAAWTTVATAFAQIAPTTQPSRAARAAAPAPDETSQGAGDNQGQVDDLLKRARKAMADGNIETADSLLTRAESLKVEYGAFHFGDTPKKARRDLNTLRAKRRVDVARPSQKSKPAASLGAAPSRGPLPAAQPATVASPDDNIAAADTSDSLPSLERPDPNLEDSPGLRSASPLSPAGPRLSGDRPAAAEEEIEPARPAAAADKLHANSLVLSARHALAVGDVRRATSLAEQANTLGAEYGLHDDSPAKVVADIRKYNDVMELGKGRQTSEGWRRQYAELLMDQSQQLLKWKDYDEAERLANAAAALNVRFNQFEVQPASLLERIAAARKGTGQPGGPAISSSAATGPVLPAAQPPKSTGAARPAARTAPALAAAANSGEALPLARKPSAGFDSPAKQRALELVRQARAALADGDVEGAGRLAREAEDLRVPDAQFGPKDDQPWMVTLDVQKARLERGRVTPAGGAPAKLKYPSTQAIYNPQTDTTRNRLAAGQPEAIATPPAAGQTDGPLYTAPPAATERLTRPPAATTSQRLFRDGEQALREQNPDKALALFRQAYTQRDQLDAQTAQRLQDHLQLLSGPPAGKSPKTPQPSLIDSASEKQQLLARQLSAEVANKQLAARKLLEKDPKRALESLKQAKAAVEQSGADSEVRAQLIRRIDSSVAECDKFITENRAQIELDAQNKAVLDEVERRRNLKLEIDAKLAKLVDQHNQLMDEDRFPEAQVVAKRLQELDPDNPIVRQISWNMRYQERVKNQRGMRDRKEQGEVRAWESIVGSSEPIDDNEPYQGPRDLKKWEETTKSRRKMLAETGSRLNERELEIERKLKTPVLLKFREAPLREVIDELSKLGGVNMHLDPLGLSEEGVDADTPVTIDLSSEISLKSALDLILPPLRLSYVIKHEVLKITSEQLRDNEVYRVVYSVADLIVPVPNFTPNRNIGLAGALSGALSDAHGYMGLGGGMATPAATVLAGKKGGTTNAVVNPAVLAQMQQLHSGVPTSGVNQPFGFGPAGAGGGAQADFDSLIDLITSTVQPNSWTDGGGPGSIEPFETNLSLVVSQTQEVHDQIKDLLQQLRRLQDLQVTIEVRFITLNDDFFERIGVDFDFNIDDNVRVNPATLDDGSPSVTVGLDPPVTGLPFPNFTSDRDIHFRQESFGLAVPTFGSPTDVASFGFAILSDIEAYFLVAAAQGDRRSNVLQAPKVTLFNGQQAFVSDTSQRPFVISVIPVVGDFAAAQQPVIVVLSEGTFLTVQAVVSNDRRFVRLTVVPFFSQIGDVKEFTFSGSKTTRKNTSSSEQGDDTSSSSDDTTVTTEGITVQLPTFSFVTVTTTVSVPDGGTVLLGGIKRLKEGRNEFGVPILSKLPYINRLFKNVGIGRETQSLMMMVTPRIIIQEEEEAKFGYPPPGQQP